MDKIDYITREENTQNVFLSEDDLDVVDILQKNYGYICDSIREEGIILKAYKCNLFKELVFEGKVVGFCSYDFSREFITAALNNIYVVPQFRGNNLFLDELQKTMIEYNKPSIMEPTRLVVELLIKYGFAKRINDNIVASALEFIVPGIHVLSNVDYGFEELSTHLYDLKMCSSIHFLDADELKIAYSAPLNYDIIHYDCLEARKQMDEEYFNILKESTEDNFIDEIISSLEEDLPVKSYTLEEVVGGEGEFSQYIESLIDDGHVRYDDAYKIKQQIIEEYEKGLIMDESLLIRLAYLFDDKKEASIKSHSDVCFECGMPTDNHDKFCHFCGINLKKEK